MKLFIFLILQVDFMLMVYVCVVFLKLEEKEKHLEKLSEQIKHLETLREQSTQEALSAKQQGMKFSPPFDVLL